MAERRGRSPPGKTEPRLVRLPRRRRGLAARRLYADTSRGCAWLVVKGTRSSLIHPSTSRAGEAAAARPDVKIVAFPCVPAAHATAASARRRRGAGGWGGGSWLGSRTQALLSALSDHGPFLSRSIVIRRFSFPRRPFCLRPSHWSSAYVSGDQVWIMVGNLEVFHLCSPRSSYPKCWIETCVPFGARSVT